MAFFDEIGKKITQTSQGVVQKTKDTAEIIKLNSSISDEEKNIANLFKEIGETYFDLHADSYEPQFEKPVLAIKEAKLKIENYSEQVKKLKGVVSCPICGGAVPYGALFCSSCGSKMNVEGTAYTNSNMRHCVNCGALLSDTTAFCTNCGTKIAAAPVPEAIEAAPVIQPAVEIPLVKHCNNCGMEIQPNLAFCTNCGSKVTE